MTELTRRDLLKVAGSLPAAAVLGTTTAVIAQLQGTRTPSNGAITRARVIPAAGRSFADPVRRFFGELRNHHGARRPYPISRAFQLLPFNVLEHSAAEALIRRGSVTFNDDMLTNKGEYIEAVFGDRNFGNIEVSFPELITARASSSASEFLIDFSGAPPTVLFLDFDPQLRIARNQRVLHIKYADPIVSYLLFEVADPERTTRLDIDLSADLVPVAQVAALSAFGYAQEPLFKSKCCGEEICSPGCSDKDKGKKPDAKDFTLYSNRCIECRGNYCMAVVYGNPFGMEHETTTEVGPNIGRVVDIGTEFGVGQCSGQGVFGARRNRVTLKITQLTLKTPIPVGPGDKRREITEIYGNRV
jgi:hypothetical protein